MLLILGSVWLCGLVLPLLYMHFNPDGDPHPDRYSVGFWMRAIKFMPVQHLPSFLFGMMLGRSGLKAASAWLSAFLRLPCFI